MPYQEIYGVNDATTVFRGTLRYAGWASLMHGFKVRRTNVNDTRAGEGH
jgi:hypothetical protein